jgi:predicted nucleotidyltransferase
MNKAEIEAIAYQYIMEKEIDDLNIVSVTMFGSRANGTNREDSDLDIKVCYTGNIKEDNLFNILNTFDDEKLYIDGIEVDFFPERMD